MNKESKSGKVDKSAQTLASRRKVIERAVGDIRACRIESLESRVLFASVFGSNGSNVAIPDNGSSFVSSTINISSP